MAGFFDGISRGITAYAERNSRLDKVRTLQSKSDDELAALGLKREDIARHVYRDIFFI